MDFLLLSQNFLEHIACILAQIGAGKPCFYPYSEQLAAYERAVFLPEFFRELSERAVSRGFVFSLGKSDYHIRACHGSAGFAQAAHSRAERRGNHHRGFSVHSVVLAKRQKHYKSLEKLDNSEEKDIFAAISGNDMSRFILCFHTGVDLSSCNEQGYNILTWIAINGNSSMVDFLIRHKDDDSGIDLTITDNNGYNMMDASVVAHNKELYTLLKKNVPSLRLTNERAHSLSAKNDFNTWLNNNL